jgi:hypothetical protein
VTAEFQFLGLSGIGDFFDSKMTLGKNIKPARIATGRLLLLEICFELPLR